ncbi:hypothetical protein M0802_002244 [Mischocyttarus mexicanus]|nr:hypothetical protein M0802_002244 [Mischocyttarus mexicanus]
MVKSLHHALKRALPRVQRVCMGVRAWAMKRRFALAVVHSASLSSEYDRLNVPWMRAEKKKPSYLVLLERNRVLSCGFVRAN